MTREAEMATILKNDPELTGLLEGGVYTEEEIGVEGIRRDSGTPTVGAFDASGRLLPCCVVREGDIVPYQGLNLPQDKWMATSQPIYIFFYQFRGSATIRIAKQRAWELLQGEKLGNSLPIWFDSETEPIPDAGPVKNSTIIRQNWMCISTRKVR